MQQCLSDLLHARQRDAGALFYCQRVTGRLQFNEGPLANGLRVDAGLQRERRRLVQRQLGGQPAEVRLLAFPSGHGPQGHGASKAVAAQRHPDAPVELGTRGVGDRDDEPAPDKEMLVLDDALLLPERARLVASEGRVPVSRRVCPVRHRQATVALAAAPAPVTHLIGHPREVSSRERRQGRLARSAMGSSLVPRRKAHKGNRRWRRPRSHHAHPAECSVPARTSGVLAFLTAWIRRRGFRT